MSSSAPSQALRRVQSRHPLRSLHSTRCFATATRPIPLPSWRPSKPFTPTLRPTSSRHLSTSPALSGSRSSAHPRKKIWNNSAARAEQQRNLRESRNATPVLPVRQAQLQRTGNVPDDTGVVPGTLIMPPPAERPSWLAPRIPLVNMARLRMENQRLRRRFWDFVSVMSLKFAWGRPWVKVRFRKTAPVAMELHRAMYESLASGDRATLSKVTCDNLRSKLTNRIDARPPRTAYIWTLHRHVGTPRVVSHRASVLPTLDDAYTPQSLLRQAVVRITSVQSLARVEEQVHESTLGAVGADEQLEVNIVEEIKEKQITEHVILQKRYMFGVEEDWKIFGTCEPTSVEDFAATIEAGNTGLPEKAGSLDA